MTDSTPVLVNGLLKTFGRRRVLDGVELAVPRGCVLGLLGKNGAGKTTLIKCLLGLLKPTAGSVTLVGQEAWSLNADAKSRIGYVPQTVTLYQWMRIRQLFAYTAPYYPRWNSARVSDLMRAFELDPEARIKTLSVGTLQKLAIILALGHEPEVLILDEPAASLDPAARRQFLKTILDISMDEKRTVIFSTHITSDLERVADRVAIVRDGKIFYHGELDELKDSIKRLHVSRTSALPPTLSVAGSLGRIRTDGADAVITVRGDWTAAAKTIQQNYGATVRVEDLNLEEIFLEIDPQNGAPR